MLSITKMSGNAADAEAASRYLEDGSENPAYKARGAEDYYQKEGGSCVWHGSPLALKALGLSDYNAPSTEERKALMLGINPQTGEKIVKSGEERTFGYDLTFSAPKSVSIEWQLNADETVRQKIQDAHDNAVKRAMDEAGKLIGSRAGAGGKEKIESVETISSLHRHGTSRELDMQLHTHGFLYNVALCPDGNFRTITTNDLYRHKMLLGAIYRAELAAGLKELGYSIEDDKDSFKLSGVSSKAEKHFSKRTEQINDYVKEHGVNSAVGMQMARLATRTGKKELSPEDLAPLWKEQADAIKYESPELSAEAKAVEYNRDKFIDELTKSHSVVKEIQVKRALVVAMQHAGRGYDDAMREFEVIFNHSEIVKLGDSETRGGALYSTKQQVSIEKAMIDAARLMRESAAEAADYEKPLETFQQEKGYKLSAEQVNAVAEMTRAGQLSLVRGVAGAGKTTAAEVAYNAFKAQGKNVVGLAIAAKASRGLKDATDRQSTIAGFLLSAEKMKEAIAQIETEIKTTTATKLHEAKERERQRLKARLPGKDTVLMIDEAGMIDSRTMQKLLAVAQEGGAKVILIGDEKQIQAIEAGGAFLAIQKYAIAEKTEITEIRRQKSEAGKAISTAFEQGKITDGFRILEQNDLITYSQDYKKSLSKVIDLWHINTMEGIEAKENVILAGLKKDVQALNNLARERLGLAGHGVIVSTDFGAREFANGDRIIFKKNQKGDSILTNGDLGEIIKIETETTKDKETGKEKEAVYLTIKRDIDGEEIKINAEDYPFIEYGYAMTTHAAQGVTVERATVFAADTAVTNRELGYVQMSRQKGDSERAGLAVVAFCDRSEETEEEEELGETEFVRKKVIEAYLRESSKGTTLDYIKDDEPAQDDYEQE